MSAPVPRPRSLIAALLGDPVEHSLSPTLHNAAFAEVGIDAVFVSMRTEHNALGDAVSGLSAANAIGASVTVPHKTSVIEFCDRLSDAAEEIGAVNCLEFGEGEIVGHNTDGVGFATALKEFGGGPLLDFSPLLLGGGGAARAVAHGLEVAGADEPVIIARTPERVEWAEALPWTPKVLAKQLAQANLVVDCTSAGLRDAAAPCTIDFERCPQGSVFATLIYHRDTALSLSARAAGLKTVDGLGMLIHQARAAFAIWTNQMVPAHVWWDAVGQSPPTAR